MLLEGGPAVVRNDLFVEIPNGITQQFFGAKSPQRRLGPLDLSVQFLVPHFVAFLGHHPGRPPARWSFPAKVGNGLARTRQVVEEARSASLLYATVCDRLEQPHDVRILDVWNSHRTAQNRSRHTGRRNTVLT